MNTKPHSHNTEHAAHPGQPDSSVPFTHHESRITSSGRKPTGKIASLPRAQRDIINRMLDDGATGKAIETEMAKHGVSLNGENISNWFQNGFQQYLQHQDHIAEMRLLRENASDLVQDYNVVQFHQAANQLAVGQIFKALTNQQLIDDPINYVRTLNALSRLSRAALVLKQCEDENIKAAGQTAKSEPIRDLETQRKLMLAAFEGATGVKAAPGPIGPDINEYLPVNPDPNPSTSSLAAPKLPGEGGSQPNESAPPAPSTCPSSPSSPSTPLPARACPADALEHRGVTRHDSLSHPSHALEHSASAPSQIKNQNRRTSLVSKFKNFEPCPSCFAPVPPLLPSGERISPHCDNCGTSLRSPGALIEYCPHCHHLLGLRSPRWPVALNPLYKPRHCIRANTAHRPNPLKRCRRFDLSEMMLLKSCHIFNREVCGNNIKPLTQLLPIILRLPFPRPKRDHTNPHHNTRCQNDDNPFPPHAANLSEFRRNENSFVLFIQSNPLAELAREFVRSRCNRNSIIKIQKSLFAASPFLCLTSLKDKLCLVMNSAPTGIAEQPSPPTEPRAHRIPELLAPAGDWECAKAAVENGADAIYFGLEKFNARMRAHNFTEPDLSKLMEFLHGRGVKGYVTFNTLVFENEMAEAEKYLRTIIASGVDAAIVQDVGICRLIRSLSPDFPIHVSTQMTITSAGGIEFARELGCNLVVLARECSLKEIEKMSGTPSVECGGEFTLPLEVFVHGALCVAYSGQCLTSEALGGRSANRGECAQACRMPYDLIADGKQVDLGDRKYLLSPQDLAGLEVLPELAKLGVASLKIEGRLKSPEYVANITRVYRKALDDMRSAADPSVSDHASRITHHESPVTNYQLEMAFSRGLYSGWFRGINNQELVHARFGKKRGVYLGEVAVVEGERVRLRLEGPLKPGDGIVFDAGHPEEKEEGGRVYGIQERQGWSTLTFGRGDVDFGRVHVGNKVWKTSDPELDRRLRQSFEGETPKFRRPNSMEVHGLEGKAMSLIVRDELGHVVQVESAMPLARAERQPLTTERLREQLGRLGGTAFELGKLENRVEGELMLPVSELNRMRRQAVYELEQLRAQPKRWTLQTTELHGLNELNGLHGDSQTHNPEGIAPSSPGLRGTSYPGIRAPHIHNPERVAPQTCDSTVRREEKGSRTRAELIVLVRSMGQLEAALKAEVRTVYCEFENPKRYRDAVELVRNARVESPSPWGEGRGEGDGDVRQSTADRNGEVQIFVVPPRIFKMGEEWTLKQVRSCEADGYLVRNYDHLSYFANDRRVGDFSLNVANRLTADYFKNKFGLERVTASYDLNFTQLEALLQAAPPEWFEVTIHQHIPMFHMEHCVFCAFLSNGTDYTNCGRPCDTRDLKLRDRVGAQHPVKADVGCRNTVFNALAQTGAEHVSRMQDLGVRHFRLELLNESAEQVAGTIAKYRQLLAGEITGQQLWRELKLLNQLGVTRGQMGVGRG